MSSAIDFETRSTKLHFKYQIVDMNELEPSIFLEENNADVILLAALTKLEDPVEQISEIIKRLNKTVDPRKFQDYLQKLEIICNLKNKEDVLEEVLKKMNIEINVKKLIGYKEGLKEGKKEGLKEGIKKGKKEGLKEGLIEAILDILTLRFKISGDIKENIKKELEKMNDIKKLKEIKKFSIEVKTLDDFLKKLH